MPNFISNTPERSLFMQGKRYLENKKHEKALSVFSKIWKDTPYKEVALNLGTAYQGMGHYKEAEYYYNLSNDINLPFTDNSFIFTEYTEALTNLGRIKYALEDDDAAIEYYRRATKLDPSYKIAWWNLCNAVFRKYCSNKYTNLEMCWSLWEYRFRHEAGVGLRNDKKDLISWVYPEKVDKLIILGEQGYGDQLMFGRYLKEAEKYCNELYVQLDDRIAGLFPYKNFKSIKESGATHGIPICSLGRTLDHIPSGKWLDVPRKIRNGKLDIGVTWSGSATHGNNHLRSTTPGYFKRLSKYGQLYTLNPKEWGTRGFTDLKSKDWVGSLNDLSKLDLVVSVDTSIVHLCGSAGIPCLVIMPLRDGDFRWGDSSMGMNNIWYSSVKVVRSTGDWETTMQKVEAIIADNNHEIWSL